MLASKMYELWSKFRGLCTFKLVTHYKIPPTQPSPNCHNQPQLWITACSHYYHALIKTSANWIWFNFFSGADPFLMIILFWCKIKGWLRWHWAWRTASIEEEKATVCYGSSYTGWWIGLHPSHQIILVCILCARSTSWWWTVHEEISSTVQVAIWQNWGRGWWMWTIKLVYDVVVTWGKT